MKGKKPWCVSGLINRHGKSEPALGSRRSPPSSGGQGSVAIRSFELGARGPMEQENPYQNSGAPMDDGTEEVQGRRSTREGDSTTRQLDGQGPLGPVG